MGGGRKTKKQIKKNVKKKNPTFYQGKTGRSPTSVEKKKPGTQPAKMENQEGRIELIRYKILNFR